MTPTLPPRLTPWRTLVVSEPADVLQVRTAEDDPDTVQGTVVRVAVVRVTVTPP